MLISVGKSLKLWTKDICYRVNSSRLDSLLVYVKLALTDIHRNAPDQQLSNGFIINSSMLPPNPPPADVRKAEVKLNFFFLNFDFVLSLLDSIADTI